MQRRLLIYETTHHETLPALVQLAHRYFDDITIAVTQQAVYDSCLQVPIFQQINITWVIKPGICTHRQFIQQLFAIARTNGRRTQLFINSPDNNLLYFAWQLLRHKRIPVAFTIHSINDYTSFKCNNIVSISETIAKCILYRRIRNYRVLAPRMPAYFNTRLPGKQVHYIPGSFFETGASFSPPSNSIRIVIPGTVEEKRRDYAMLLSVARRIATIPFTKPIEFVLLGSSGNEYGRRIIDQLKQATKHGCIVITAFDGHVSEQDYCHYYKTAHLVWSPLQPVMRSLRGVKEINALSHSTGFIIDFVRLGCPSLIPEAIKISPVIDELLFHYKDEDALVDQLTRFINDPALLEAQRTLIAQKCALFSMSAFEAAFCDLLHLKNN